MIIFHPSSFILNKLSIFWLDFYQSQGLFKNRQPSFDAIYITLIKGQLKNMILEAVD